MKAFAFHHSQTASSQASANLGARTSTSGTRHPMCTFQVHLITAISARQRVLSASSQSYRLTVYRRYPYISACLL